MKTLHSEGATTCRRCLQHVGAIGTLGSYFACIAGDLVSCASIFRVNQECTERKFLRIQPRHQSRSTAPHPPTQHSRRERSKTALKPRSEALKFRAMFYTYYEQKCPGLIWKFLVWKPAEKSCTGLKPNNRFPICRTFEE